MSKWVVTYLPNGWPNDECPSGFVVHRENQQPKDGYYTYLPEGKSNATEFARLANLHGEVEACKRMGYAPPRSV